MTPYSRLKPKKHGRHFVKVVLLQKTYKTSSEQKNTLNKETDFIYDATKKSSVI